jgi:hypothetical protein
LHRASNWHRSSPARCTAGSAPRRHPALRRQAPNVHLCDDGRVVLTDFGIACSLVDEPGEPTQMLAASPLWLIRQRRASTPTCSSSCRRRTRHSYDGVHYADSPPVLSPAAAGRLAPRPAGATRCCEVELHSPATPLGLAKRAWHAMRRHVEWGLAGSEKVALVGGTDGGWRARLARTSPEWLTPRK